MSNLAVKSFGAALTIASTAVGGLVDINVTGADVTMIDITEHASTGGYKEFVGGLLDAGHIEIQGNHIQGDAGQIYLRTHPGISAAFSLTLSSTKTVTGNCIIGAYNLTNPLDGKIGFTCQAKITGGLTFSV